MAIGVVVGEVCELCPFILPAPLKGQCHRLSLCPDEERTEGRALTRPHVREGDKWNPGLSATEGHTLTTGHLGPLKVKVPNTSGPGICCWGLREGG